MTVPSNREVLLQHFENWVHDQMARLVPETVDKAITYGGVDLDIMGEAMQHLIFHGDGVDSGSGVYAAIQFYLLGKISRAVGALERGRMPTPDTDDDLIVYAMMAKYVRLNGGEWISEAMVPKILKEPELYNEPRPFVGRLGEPVPAGGTFPTAVEQP